MAALSGRTEDASDQLVHRISQARNRSPSGPRQRSACSRAPVSVRGTAVRQHPAASRAAPRSKAGPLGHRTDRAPGPTARACGSPLCSPSVGEAFLISHAFHLRSGRHPPEIHFQWLAAHRRRRQRTDRVRDVHPLRPATPHRCARRGHQCPLDHRDPGAAPAVALRRPGGQCRGRGVLLPRRVPRRPAGHRHTGLGGDRDQRRNGGDRRGGATGLAGGGLPGPADVATRYGPVTGASSRALVDGVVALDRPGSGNS